MRAQFLEFMEKYLSAKETKDNAISDLVTHLLPDELAKAEIFDTENTKIQGSVGNGAWSVIPWIAIMNKQITDTVQNGVYIVYLLSKDTKKLFLTLNQGCTAIENKYSGSGKTKNTKKELRDNADYLKRQLNNLDIFSFGEPDLGELGNCRGKYYPSGTIFYKEYHKSNMPDEEELQNDLRMMAELYNEYYEKVYKRNSVPEKNKNKVEETSFSCNINETVSYVVDYITSKGYYYDEALVKNFYLSLKSKPFVILAGTSGTGKTRLVKLFAEAIGAFYHLVSVRPDWSDGSDLFGHYDLNGKFIKGPVCGAFEDAINNPDKPVMLCLDEMNLARVEYYLSDFLSVIESREKQSDGRIVTSACAQYKEGIPDNLYIVGTVNMDETTFPFSKKVLDRANTIEFNLVDLKTNFDSEGDEVQPLSVPNSFLKTEYLVLAKDCVDEAEFVNKICDELQELNGILLKANAHVGYRVRDEIVFYMLNNKKADNLLPDNQPMDNEIMQKILPRIQGSAGSIKDLLLELFRFCMGGQAVLDADNGKAGEQMRSLAPDGKYPESAKKISYMMERYEEDGFTSYWL